MSDENDNDGPANGRLDDIERGIRRLDERMDEEQRQRREERRRERGAARVVRRSLVGLWLFVAATIGVVGENRLDLIPDPPQHQVIYVQEDDRRDQVAVLPGAAEDSELDPSVLSDCEDAIQAHPELQPLASLAYQGVAGNDGVPFRDVLLYKVTSTRSLAEPETVLVYRVECVVTYFPAGVSLNIGAWP